MRAEDDVTLKVSEVESRSALIQLTAPSVNSAEVAVEPSEFQYELSLSDKQDGAYTVMYRLAVASSFESYCARLCLQHCSAGF